MIPINPTAKLVIVVILAGIIAALQALLKLEPTWVWVGGVVQVAMLVEMYFTPPSTTAKSTVPPIVGGLLFCFALLVAACTPSQGTTVATVAAPVATTAVCIITTYAVDSSQGKAPPAIVLDIVGKCGTDALTIAQVLDAQARAETIASGNAAPVAAAAHAMAAADAGLK